MQALNGLNPRFGDIVINVKSTNEEKPFETPLGQFASAIQKEATAEYRGNRIALVYHQGHERFEFQTGNNQPVDSFILQKLTSDENLAKGLYQFNQVETATGLPEFPRP